MPTEEPRPVDLTQFQALAGSEEAMRDLASYYIPFVAERLDALRTAVTAGATDRVETIARQLAGANAAAGVTDIVAPLVSLERMAQQGHLKTAAGALVDAEAEFARITDFLLQYVE